MRDLKVKHINKPFPGGEAAEEAVARVQTFFIEMKDKYPDATVLVVGHQATQFALDVLIDNKTLQGLLTQPFVPRLSSEYDW